jgi:hypothetical protein
MRTVYKISERVEGGIYVSACSLLAVFRICGVDVVLASHHIAFGERIERANHAIVNPAFSRTVCKLEKNKSVLVVLVANVLLILVALTHAPTNHTQP